MSTLIATIKDTGKDQDAELDCVLFAGKDGVMIQITQSIGTIINMDTPGFIQLTKNDAKELQKVLIKFINK